MSRVRVVLVDDTQDVRTVIGALLEHDGRFQVIGEAADGAAAIDLVQETQPGLVLLDLTMPVLDGLSALPRIRQASPEAKIVVLSAFGNDQTVQAALDAGAEAFVSKGGRVTETLFPVLEKVMGGATVMAEKPVMAGETDMPGERDVAEGVVMVDTDPRAGVSPPG